MAVEKLKVSEQAEVRANLYGLAEQAIQEAGRVTETISDGMLVHLGEGQYAKVKISYCDPEKFNLEDAREAYKEKLDKAAERAEKARKAAEEKERKALEKAAKAAEKTAE